MSQWFLLLFIPGFPTSTITTATYVVCFCFSFWVGFASARIFVVAPLVSCYPSLIFAIKPFMSPCVVIYIRCRFWESANRKFISAVYKPSLFLYYELPQCLCSDPSLGGIPQSVLIKSWFI